MAEAQSSSMTVWIQAPATLPCGRRARFAPGLHLLSLAVAAYRERDPPAGPSHPAGRLFGARPWSAAGCTRRPCRGARTSPSSPRRRYPPPRLSHVERCAPAVRASRQRPHLHYVGVSGFTAGRTTRAFCDVEWTPDDPRGLQLNGSFGQDFVGHDLVADRKASRPHFGAYGGNGIWPASTSSPSPVDTGGSASRTERERRWPPLRNNISAEAPIR